MAKAGPMPFGWLKGADIIAIDICAQIDTVTYPMSTPDDLAEVAAAVEHSGRRVVPVQADVRDLTAMKDSVEKGVSQLGRLDIVLPNAGIMFHGLDDGRDDEESATRWM